MTLISRSDTLYRYRCGSLQCHVRLHRRRAWRWSVAADNGPIASGESRTFLAAKEACRDAIQRKDGK